MPDDNPRAAIAGATELKVPASQMQSALNNLSSEVDMLQDTVLVLVKRLQPITAQVAETAKNGEGVDRAPRSEYVESVDNSAGRVRNTRNIVNILLENLEV